MKTPFYGVCHRGSSPKYFETSPNLLGTKFIEIEQFEISCGKKSNFGEKHNQNCGSSAKAYCAYIRVNLRYMVCMGKRNKSCVILE